MQEPNKIIWGGISIVCLFLCFFLFALKIAIDSGNGVVAAVFSIFGFIYCVLVMALIDAIG